MVPGDAQADLLVYLEAAVRRQQNDRRRLHRIVIRQDDATVVEAVGKVRLGGAAHGKVPLKDVVLKGWERGRRKQ